MNENPVFLKTKEDQKPTHAPSLTLGILSIVFGLLIPLAGEILGIIGIVQAAVRRKEYNATAGLTCSIIGLVIAVINHILGIVLMALEMM